MSILSVTKLTEKSLEIWTVLKDISFQISDGEIVFHHRIFRFRKIYTAALYESAGDSGHPERLKSMERTLVKTENGTPVYSGERCSKRDFNGNRICISEFQSVSSLQCIKERNGSACLCGRGGKRRGQEKGNGTA